MKHFRFPDPPPPPIEDPAHPDETVKKPEEE
jgi:hypothetical protein